MYYCQQKYHKKNTLNVNLFLIYPNGTVLFEGVTVNKYQLAPVVDLLCKKCNRDFLLFLFLRGSIYFKIKQKQGSIKNFSPVGGFSNLSLLAMFSFVSPVVSCI